MTLLKTARIEVGCYELRAGRWTWAARGGGENEIDGRKIIVEQKMLKR